jgi:hypothetical protein
VLQAEVELVIREMQATQRLTYLRVQVKVVVEVEAEEF